MYSPSSSPLSPRAFQHHSTFASESLKASLASTIGISPRVGFVTNSTVNPMWMDAYRQLSNGFGRSTSSPTLSSSPGFSALSSYSSSLHVLDASPPRRHSYEEPLSGVLPHKLDLPQSPPPCREPTPDQPALESALTASPIAVHIDECTTSSSTSDATEPCDPSSPACPAAVQPSSGLSTPSGSPPSSAPITPVATPVQSRRSSIVKNPSSSIRKKLSWADFSGSNLEQSVSFLRDDEPRRCKAGGYGFGFRSPFGLCFIFHPLIHENMYVRVRCNAFAWLFYDLHKDC